MEEKLNRTGSNPVLTTETTQLAGVVPMGFCNAAYGPLAHSVRATDS